MNTSYDVKPSVHKHPAKVMLDFFSKQFPRVWKDLDAVREQISTNAQRQFETCHYSRDVAVIYQHLAMQEGIEHPPSFELTAALANWRMTQGIYRFDSLVMQALRDTDLKALPAAVKRLPEWCVYIETPGEIDHKDRMVLGMWAYVSDQFNEPWLHVLTLIETEPGSVTTASSSFPIGIDIEKGVQDHDRLIFEEGHIDEAQLARAHEEASQLIPRYRALLNFVIYLCASPDFSRNGSVEVPANPQPVKTRHQGTRLFPADGPKVWEVGVRMGTALRAAQDAVDRESQSTGAESIRVRPHIRRAHWHTFYSGPRKTADGHEIPTRERRAEVKWIPPLAVNVDNLDDLPAVIRKVK